MSAARAEELVGQIVTGLQGVAQAINELAVNQGWLALGYESWEELCGERIQPRVTIGPDARPALATELYQLGHSTRMIAAATGVSQTQARRLVAGEPPRLTTGVTRDGVKQPGSKPGLSLADVNRELADHCRTHRWVVSEVNDSNLWAKNGAGQSIVTADDCGKPSIVWHPEAFGFGKTVSLAKAKQLVAEHPGRPADFEDVELPHMPAAVVDVESVEVEEDDPATMRRCGLCGESFPGWDALTDHVEDTHVTSPAEVKAPTGGPVQCPDCPASFTLPDEQDGWDAHQHQHHDDLDDDDEPHLSWSEVAGEAWALHDLADGVIGAWPTGDPTPVQLADIRNDLLLAADRIRDMLRRLPEQPAIRAAS